MECKLNLDKAVKKRKNRTRETVVRSFYNSPGERWQWLGLEGSYGDGEK